MSIRYVLFENNLTSDPNDYAATVQAAATADLDAVIDRVIQQGSTVTRADLVSALEGYFTAIEAMVLEGMNVNTPSANYSVSIKGVFNGATDSFDASRHQVTATVTPGKRFRAAIKARAQAVKGEAARPMPNPVEFTDMNSGERNSVATPGGMGRLVGSRLKVDPADAAQGVYFVAADGTATQVQVLGQNKPAELMFLVPALAAGDYTLEVRAAIRGGPDVRTGALPATLAVA
jgi:hypothetical protein